MIKMVKNTHISTYSIYNRQYDAITKLVDEKIFLSKSEVIREALDFFFSFPYFKKIAEGKLTLNSSKQEKLEAYYNSKVIKRLI